MVAARPVAERSFADTPRQCPGRLPGSTGRTAWPRRTSDPGSAWPLPRGWARVFLDPPQVPERVADAPDPVTPGQLGQPGHHRGAGRHRPVEHRLGVGDVQPQQARSGDREGRVEHHDDRIADPRLGMPDRAAFHLHPPEFLGVEGLLEELQQPPGVVGDHPGRDGPIAFGDRRRLGHRLLILRGDGDRPWSDRARGRFHDAGGMHGRLTLLRCWLRRSRSRRTRAGRAEATSRLRSAGR